MNRAAEWATAAVLAAASALGWALAEEDYAWGLHVVLETNTEDDFDDAKETLFNEIDILPGNQIRCRYSDTLVTMVANANGVFKPPTNAGVQVEHTWPSKANWADANSGQFPPCSPCARASTGAAATTRSATCRRMRASSTSIRTV